MDKKIVYKDFIIGDMFISQNGDKDIKQEHINDKGTPVITSGLNNNGVLGKTDMPAKVIDKNTITIDMFGNAFYRDFEYKMVTHARVFSLEPINKELTTNTGLYITTQLSKLHLSYSYSNMCSYNKIKNATISLPIKTDEDDNPIIDDTCEYHKDGFIPDFDFMEEFIQKKIGEETCKKVEECIHEMIGDTFLLTEKEQKALDGKKNKVEKDFIVGDMFEKISTSKINGKASDFPENKEGEYIIPLLTAGINHNGLSKYAKPEQCSAILHNVISISANGTNSGATFYQSEKFAVLQDAYAIKLINGYVLGANLGLYFATVINKVLTSKYNWNNKANWTKVKSESISLPIKTDEDDNPIIDDTCEYHKDGFIPDFDFMENYISGFRKKEYKKMCDDTEDGSIRVSHI